MILLQELALSSLFCLELYIADTLVSLFVMYLVLDLCLFFLEIYEKFTRDLQPKYNSPSSWSPALIHTTSSSDRFRMAGKIWRRSPVQGGIRGRPAHDYRPQSLAIYSPDVRIWVLETKRSERDVADHRLKWDPFCRRDHKRHRKVLLPGFGGPESRAFWPIFSGFAAQLSSKWKDMISSSSNQEVVVDIPRWTSRATLDAIGEAAFDYQFGTMDNKETRLSAAYFTLLAKTYGSPSNAAIFMQNLWAYFPPRWLPIISKYTPGMTLKHAKYTEEVTTDVASKLIQTRMERLSHGEVNHDIMSLLGLSILASPFVITRWRLRFYVLPLSKPVTLTTGEVLHEISIPKGQKFRLSLAGYNRSKVIFGEDAHVFNPDRWLSTIPKNSVNVGIYSNLLTFGGGLRACIGFRFALIEFQAFLVELVSTFEFALTEEAKNTRRESHGVMVPFIEGQADQEAHLPLKVTFALNGAE
ncbi:hypothetical protein CCMSSC00406_0003513 [Pleurotus cornucopiae]|uniref:Uncharacterized protein n=1 Tax=Pleurotus cornucopiae TaxID=5321 RepID=A0ACB7J8A3_PLECO|nr:hypothetical protein CCMSSC00406_0003513 [Pleurotus cornucopiae]